MMPILPGNSSNQRCRHIKTPYQSLVYGEKDTRIAWRIGALPWEVPSKSILQKEDLNLKILYELTYATRGQSGIPRDAISVAKMLMEKDEFQTDLALNPRSYTKRSNFKRTEPRWVSENLGDALRREPGRSIIPPLVTSGLIFFQSLSLSNRVELNYLDDKLNVNTLTHFKLLNSNNLIQKTRIALIPLSYLARFARPRFLRPFKLLTSDYDVFIQQQADPISVKKDCIHVVRLHDFLPITHPQFFDHNSVKVFSKSLRIMLKGNKKIWVMDSESTAREFREYFGSDLDVRVIPCSVSQEDLRPARFEAKRKNQICMVNTIEPRKRVSLAIAGFHQAKRSGVISPDWRLVIVGGEGWQETVLATNLRKNLFGSDIVFKENAPDFELQQIFNESKIVLSTASAEGFGLPPLEGMINGCVPVVSDIPQHHETVGEYGFYFSGENPEKVAIAISEAAALIEREGSEIEIKLKTYVKENYSEEVVGKMWSNLLNSLVK